MSHDALSSLHTALIDAREGYEKAIEKTDEPLLAPLFQDMMALHGAAHEDVHGFLTAKGEEADETGSFMGNVHKAVISVRSAITGIDHDSLSAFASGEESTLERYDDAIGEEADPRVRASLEEHRRKLAAKIVQMKSAAV